MITGARTINNSGSVVPEARIRYYVNGDRQGHELEEFHYNAKGDVIYYCKSTIDPDTGFKTGESEALGEKETDYYFLWPLRTNAVE